MNSILPSTTVSIIIPTYNRLNYLLEALDSVLKQTLDDNYSLNIIISDNSTNSTTEKHFSSTVYPNVRYIRRSPPIIPSIEHFNTILTEVATDFFMIFHDDDVMRENMILELLESFTPSTVAAASNAYILKNGQKTSKKFVDDTHTPNPITTKKELLDCLVLGKGGGPLFPSYLYRRIVSQKLQFDSKYDAYTDTHFVCQILDYGSIHFIKKPLFYYRSHIGQDSSHAYFIARSRLLNYSIKEHNYSRRDKLIIHQRLINIYLELREQLLSQNMPSLKRILQFITLCITNNKISLVGRLVTETCLKKFKVKSSKNRLSPQQ